MPVEKSEPVECVLIKACFDSEDPTTGEIALRFSTGRKTYSQKFILSSLEAYGNMWAVQNSQVNVYDNVLLQLIEGRDEKDPSLPTRRLVLFTDNQEDVILHDEKDGLREFKDAFGMSNESVLVLNTIEPRKLDS